MKFYLINGSPRKKYNTAKLLDSASLAITDEYKKHQLQEDVDVEIIDLYDLDYKGCKSCFHCKKIEGKYYGNCPIKDDLRQLLPKIWECDGLIIASPIYFTNITGQTRSFLERLLFPKYVYGAKTLAKPKPTAFIYTMNVKKEFSDQQYPQAIYDNIERFIKYTFVYLETLKVYDTYQFKDYSLYENYLFDEKEKKQQQLNQFPKDLESAYNLGIKIFKQAMENKNE